VSEQAGGEGVDGEADVSIVIYARSGHVGLAAALDEVGYLVRALKSQLDLTADVTLACDCDGPVHLPGGLPAGVRRVQSSEAGYGVTLRQGVQATRGRYLVLSDASGQYRLSDAVPMVRALMDGAGMCNGIRFDHRPDQRQQTGIGTRVARQVKRGIARRLFGIEATDIRCRLRTLHRSCWDRQKLGGIHDELAGEMLAKAALRGERIDEHPLTTADGAASAVPVASHVGNLWGEVRYLLMLSPVGLYAAPAILLGGWSLSVLLRAGLHELTHDPTPDAIGNYWVILAAAMLGLSHLAMMLAVAGHLFGLKEGFRRPGPLSVLLARRLSLESMLLAGGVLFSLGLAVLGYVAASWVKRSFGATYSVYLPVVGVLLLTLAGQTVFFGFLLAVLGGHRARFLDGSRSLIDHGPGGGRADRTHSFVVLAYKDSPFLPACVASVCAQTVASSVVITTSTPSAYIDEVAARFGVPVKVNPQRAGIAADWAFGLAATDARYVTLAHQDDVYYPTFAEQTLDAFGRWREGVVCFTGYEEIDDDGRPKSSKISKIKHLIQFFAIGGRERVGGRSLHAILALGNTLPCSTVTYDRQSLGDFRFSDSLASNLDWDAWMSLLDRGETFLHVNARVVGRRHNALTETSALIRDGRRAREDLIMFRRLWPKAIGDVIAFVYRLGY
jgi:glycosyltransferase involved in cell wall biosynthesis